jgi:hypothetical protein
MKTTPMFIRFVNNDIGAQQVAASLASSTGDEESREIAEKMTAGEGLYDVERFRDDFGNCLVDFIDNGPVPPVIQYLDAYMASIEEVVDHEGRGSYGTTSRYAQIRDPEGPWVEGLVCYNFCLYLKAFGKDELKRCPTCGRFFAHKGKYAKYCSEDCKRSTPGG